MLEAHYFHYTDQRFKYLKFLGESVFASRNAIGWQKYILHEPVVRIGQAMVGPTAQCSWSLDSDSRQWWKYSWLGRTTRQLHLADLRV